MATRMLQRRGTAAQWANANPILGSGEIGFETDSGQFKMGDGTSNWSALSYFKNLEDLGGLDDFILLTEKGSANGVATLDGSNLIPVAQIPSSIARSTDVSNLVANAVANLVGTAPGLLDTLGELADALNDDESFYLTVANTINNSIDAANEYTDNSISTLSNNVGQEIDLLDEIVANNLANAVTGLQNEIANAQSAAEQYANTLVEQEILDRDTAIEAESFILGNTIANAITDLENYADDAVDTHNLLTTNIHGIANTAVLVTLTDLTNHETDTSNVHGITNTLALVVTNDSRLSDERTPSNGSVTESKIANNAVTAAKIANDAITNSKLANDAVDTAEIKDNAVTNSKLAGSIDQSKITNLVTDLSSKQDKVSGITDTEIGYLDGVTSLIQNQINSKLNLSGGTMTGALTLSGEPSADLHAATKLYVDNVVSGLNFHQPVRVATTGNITLSGTQTIDGVALSVGDRVLVKDQSNQKNNGIYEVKNNSWTRTADADNTPAGELKGGDFTLVLEGDTNSGYGFVCSNTSTITIGSSDITYVAFNAAKAISAGNGLSEPTPGTIAIDTETTVDKNTVQTLTNKTISGSTNTITNVSLTTGVTGTLPVANGGTGITSLGNGIATFLGNPSATNLASAVVDETGSGALVFANSPTLVTPTLGAASATSITFPDGSQTMQGVPSLTPIIQKTSNYTLSALSERDDLIEMNSSSAITLTIPLNSAVAFPIGTSLDILQTGTGQVTIAGDTGVTVNATPGLKLRTQWSSVTLFKRATNTWVVYGDLTA